LFAIVLNDGTFPKTWIAEVLPLAAAIAANSDTAAHVRRRIQSRVEPVWHEGPGLTPVVGRANR
jgi:hypothetical protein